MERLQATAFSGPMLKMWKSRETPLDFGPSGHVDIPDDGGRCPRGAFAQLWISGRSGPTALRSPIRPPQALRLSFGALLRAVMGSLRRRLLKPDFTHSDRPIQHGSFLEL